MADNIQYCRHIMTSLHQLFEQIQTSIGNSIDIEPEEPLLKEPLLKEPLLIEKLHLHRVQLSAELMQCLPSPLPAALGVELAELQQQTQALLKTMNSYHRQTRDAMLQLQSYRKAQKVYQNISMP